MNSKGMIGLALCAGIVANVVGGQHFAARAALVQPASQTQSFFVVEADKTPAHCKDSANFYRVAELNKGQILVVDQEGDNWLRAAYPAELSAFVRVEDVSVNGNELKVTQPSRLKAANLAAGWAGSWQPLLTTPLAVGATLTKREDIRETAEGPVVGFRVAPPSEARLFVQVKNVRKATDAEVAAFQGKSAEPAPAQTADQVPASPVAPETAAKPAEPVVAPANSADLTQPQVTQQGTGNAAQPLEPVPTTIQQGGKNESIVAPASTASQPETAPTTPAPAAPASAPATPEPTPAQKQAALVESLESKLRAIAAQPVLTSEMDELIAEFEKAIESETDGRRKQSLAGRLEYLKMRREFRETVRRQEQARAEIEGSNASVKQALEDVAKIRVYTLVGTLQPSTVYDGKQLPLMYRVVSVGTAAPKTLGYLKPGSDWDFDKMLGLVIGVIGNAEIDRSLQLNVITPVRVDVLRPEGEGKNFRIESAPKTSEAVPAPTANTAPAPEAAAVPDRPLEINK